MAEPKVRFKRDDGNSYPAWTAGKLGDITEKVDRKAPKGSTAPVMMVSQGNGFIYQADKYSRENAGQSLKNYTLLKQGEFAYNHGASKAKPYGVAYCLTEELEARVPFVYHTFRITDGVNPYWHEALNTSKMDRQLKRMVSSGARMDGLLNINYDTYMDVDVNIPSLEEQRKIAEFLSLVDEVITASEQEVANLETQKKAVMKKIFSQEVRFKRADGTDFPEWEEKTLGEACEPLQYGMNAAAGKYDGQNKYIRITDIDDSTHAYMEDNVVSPTGELSDKYLVCKGDILLARTGASTGKSYLYKENDGRMYFAGFLIRAHVKAGYDEYFIYSQTLTHAYEKWVKLTSQRSGQPGINAEEYSGYVLQIPCLEEQRLIADFLSDFDEAIAAAKKELELWKELRKGLQQQMFV